MLLKLDFSSEQPIYTQIRNQVVLALAEGRLLPGERLPTIRALAGEAGINMMTVSKAYQQLKQEGYIETDRRSGAVVCGRAGEAGLSELTEQTLRLLISEAKLAGISKAELLGLCGKCYDEMEGGSEK